MVRYKKKGGDTNKICDKYSYNDLFNYYFFLFYFIFSSFVLLHDLLFCW